MDNTVVAANSNRKTWTLEEIERSIREHSIVVFLKGTAIKPKCGFSARIVSMLEKHGLDYHSIDISENKGLAGALSAFSGKSEVPLVFINGVIAGCNEALEQALEALNGASMQMANA